VRRKVVNISSWDGAIFKMLKIIFPEKMDANYKNVLLYSI